MVAGVFEEVAPLIPHISTETLEVQAKVSPLMAPSKAGFGLAAVVQMDSVEEVLEVAQDVVLQVVVENLVVVVWAL